MSFSLLPAAWILGSLLALQGPGKVQPPRNLEDLARIAAARAARALERGKLLLQRYRADLSLSYDQNREFVERAVRALASRGTDLAPLLLPLLDPKNQSDRARYLAENAARVLERMGTGAFLPRLERLLREGSPPARALAARLLGRSGRKEAVPPLMEALKDPDPAVVASAVEALGELGAREARKALLGLFSTQDPRLRKALVRSLAKVGEPGDLDRALASFAGNRDEGTLFLLLDLVQALGKGSTRALRFSADLAASEGLSLALRQRAMEALGALARKGDKETMGRLRKLIKNPLTPESLRRQAAYILYGLGDTWAKKVVLGPAERFLKKNPRIPYAWVNRGDVYFKLGRYAKALQDYNRAVQLCGSSSRAEPHTWAQIFLCCLKLGKKRELLRAVKKSRLGPKVLAELLQGNPELLEACRRDQDLARAFQLRR